MNIAKHTWSNARRRGALILEHGLFCDVRSIEIIEMMVYLDYEIGMVSADSCSVHANKLKGEGELPVLPVLVRLLPVVLLSYK
jgi:hypothetical protein